MNQELEKIVLGCRRHDPEAQKRFYDAFAPKMMGLCRRYVSCREEAQDILHDGFIAAFEHIDELDDAQSLLSWLGRIMVNRTLNYVTRNNRLVYSDMVELAGVADEQDQVLDTDQFCLSDVLAAIDRLPDNYRVAFNMHDIELMPYAEMAKALGQSEVNVRSMVFRARQMLRGMLVEEIENEKNNDVI